MNNTRFPPVFTTARQSFQAALADARSTQERILHDLLHSNAASAFGRRYGFERIHSYADFAARVPVHTYADYQADIEALAAGTPGVLTTEAVTLFEETGGSSGGAKLIPYTPSLLAAFRRAVLPWLADLAQFRPQALAGRLFFIISPAGRSRSHTAGGIAIGNGDDLAYFGADTAAWLAERTLFQPELMQQQSAERWQWHSARVLLSAPDLSFISVWSPTLLLTILNTLQQQADSLLATLPDPARRRHVAQALACTPMDTRTLWPQLDTVSAWDSHTAAAPAAALRALFPHVHLQGKGLLATEAVSSIPFSGSPWPLLAVDSHFYEFADEVGGIHLPHSLDSGARYRVIVSTQGGLYRYDSGDCVHIHGLLGGVPQMEFVGRNSLTSDLCGEKLTEAFVQAAMRQVDAALPQQALLQAVMDNPPYYRLCVDAAVAPPERAQQLAAALDHALGANPQYAHARRIGQLGALQAAAMDDLQTYAAGLHRAEQRLATRKVSLLLPPCVLPDAQL
ncbi:hypothetical protein L1281_002220 [Neisseria sp. HSC-16F19]|nr:GH3 auxin-responsive promoter family protein [Neisseria sp. HSC-16F19]MCP2041611.1 hypothetical protein [Neisseria sp. HSC-16F19]